MWRVKFTLAKIRKAARELLTLDEKDARRLFEGTCLRLSVFMLYRMASDLNQVVQIVSVAKNSS